MKLTLVGTEIDQAIQAYVSNLITVKDGMVITVELKATRGTDGPTAEIDISPAAAAPVVAQSVHTPSTPVERTSTKKVSTSAPKEEVVQVEEASAPVAVEVAQDTDKAEAQTEAATRPSLFSNLKKPVNE